jgi:hypothetical protein
LVLANDAVGDEQSHAGTVLLGGEVGLEQAGAVLGRNTRAFIGDAKELTVLTHTAVEADCST